jgi:NAD(P)-dependent dehydrogenase (short-subunit alcohol dehydrogenase family)
MNKGSSGKYSSPLRATVKGISDLFKKPKDEVKLLDTDRLEGKNILITGASSGLGFEAAVQLAKRGAHVVMACRSGIPQQGEKVQQLSGSRKVEMIKVDLSDMDSIVHLAEELERKTLKLDIVICNAAVVPAKSRRTRQGLEEMFMVNYLAKYLLIRLIIQRKMLNSSDNLIPRIIFVSSESHRNPKLFDWDNFGKYREYSMGKTVELYGYYKLLMTTFANELSRRINQQNNTPCSVFALCPGPVNTNIAREAPSIFAPLLKLIFSIFFRSPKVAVRPLIYFSCSSEPEGRPIDYLFLMTRKDMDEKSMNMENGRKLWELSEKLLAEHGIEFQSL